MITRIEIDGFKTFEDFELDLMPFTAIVGPNASGKSNLFDALRLLSSLANSDVRSAMEDLRGEPMELFRRTATSAAQQMSFAVEVLLDATGVDAFGTKYQLKTQRLRYEVVIQMKHDSAGNPKGIYVQREQCSSIAKKEDHAAHVRGRHWVKYSGQLKPFIRMKHATDPEHAAIEIRQDGATKRGRPVTLPANEASRTALSTVSTAEFPHLYALRDFFIGMSFLELNPQAARNPSDRFEQRTLKPDASNLSAVLAKLQQETRTTTNPEGVLVDISSDLSALIPSVRSIVVRNDPNAKEYSFALELTDELNFSSRVISDGTLRLLALLTALNDPQRKGLLCFEEPENGVHEGRIPLLVDYLRGAACLADREPTRPLFQILVNTHSPVVMEALCDEEIVVADVVATVVPGRQTRSVKTRMRTGVQPTKDLFDPTKNLTRSEVEKLLRRAAAPA